MHPLVSDRPPELKEERAPDWSPVSSLTADSGKTAVSSVLRRAVVAAIVGVVLWWLGYRLAAGVLLALLVLVTTASVLFPSVATGVDHVMRAVQRVVGQALSLVVLSIVQLLVFTPLSLLFRLAGHDPLALG